VDPPPEPFTLVIQIDAWNIRERDHWGQTQAMRRRQEELNRWHWVYTATCFRLQHRCRKGKSKNKLRAIITERSYVATRGGVDALMKQLYYEARARGLAQAQRVLVIADGAVWIWNLVEDRFKDAVQRLDLFHAKSPPLSGNVLAQRTLGTAFPSRQTHRRLQQLNPFSMLAHLVRSTDPRNGELRPQGCRSR
jgi:hypothetical protein